jgi:Putative beta-barrel porin 2
MSSSSRRSAMPIRPAAASLLVAGMSLAAVSGQAAEVYWQPTASLTAEENTNIDLSPPPVSSTAGYIADAAALIGIATPQSDTTLRPRVDYRDYPTDSTDNRLEEYLDVNSSYRSQRSKASMYLGFERRDDFNAELSQAFFNDTGPVSPTNPETGRAKVGETRTSFVFLPDYNYSLTPRLAAGVAAIYQQLDYSPDNNRSAVDFRYYQGKAYLRWTIDQKNDVTLGGFGSKYEARRFVSTGTAEGGSLQLDTSWTPLLTTAASVTYQHTSLDSVIPRPFQGTVNSYGVNLSSIYKTELNSFQGVIGRLITPTGGGGLYVNEQAQLQYAHVFSRRLTLTGAVIALKNHGLTSNVSGDDRTYERLAVDAKWMLTPTLFVQGGYQYFRQKYQVDTNSADNNRIYIRFGYQALGRQL